MTHRGHYSLIQFCPDQSRLETCNVGVVLFCAEPYFFGVKTTKKYERARAFFGSRVCRNLLSYTKAFETKLKLEDVDSVERLHVLGGLCANDILLTPPRPIKINDPQNELLLLFDELVEQPSFSCDRSA